MDIHGYVLVYSVTSMKRSEFFCFCFSSSYLHCYYSFMFCFCFVFFSHTTGMFKGLVSSDYFIFLKCKLQVNHHNQLMCKLKCTIFIYLNINAGGNIDIINA